MVLVVTCVVMFTDDVDHSFVLLQFNSLRIPKQKIDAGGNSFPCTGQNTVAK